MHYVLSRCLSKKHSTVPIESLFILSLDLDLRFDCQCRHVLVQFLLMMHHGGPVLRLDRQTARDAHAAGATTDVAAPGAAVYV